MFIPASIDSTVAVYGCALRTLSRLLLNLPASYGDDTIASCLKRVSFLVFMMGCSLTEVKIAKGRHMQS